jgi:hypothetical protein
MKKKARVAIFGFVCLMAGRLGGHYEWGQTLAQAAQSQNTYTSITAWDLPVRVAGETNFTDRTKKVNVEVIRDNTRANIVYISEAGSIAVVPER